MTNAERVVAIREGIGEHIGSDSLGKEAEAMPEMIARVDRFIGEQLEQAAMDASIRRGDYKEVPHDESALDDLIREIPKRAQAMALRVLEHGMALTLEKMLELHRDNTEHIERDVVGMMKDWKCTREEAMFLCGVYQHSTFMLHKTLLKGRENENAN